MAEIVIVSFPDDEHGNVLERTLRGRGAEVTRTSLSDVADRFTWELESPTPHRSRQPPARRGIWRRPGVPAIASVDERFGDFAASEIRDAFRGAWLSRDMSWLNEPSNLWRTEHKLVQLRSAQRLGIRVPDTIVTNDPLVAKRFAAGRPTIAKAVRYGLVAATPEPRMAWTQLVQPDVEFDFSGVPVLFQEAIRSRTPFRVATVGGQAFASRLVTDVLDWRATPLASQMWQALDPSEAPPGIRRDAVRLARSMRLNYTSQDWVGGETSQPTFLEANPNGQWLFLDGETPGRVTHAIADWLMRRPR